MSTPKKQRTFSAMFKVTGDFNLDVKADSLEDALAQGRAMEINEAFEAFVKSKACWNDYSGTVYSVYDPE